MSTHPPSDPNAERFAEVLDRPVPGGDAPTQGQKSVQTARALFEPFMALSRVLVGRDDLAPWLGRAYLGTLLDGAEKSAESSDFKPHYGVVDILATFTVFEGIAATHPDDLERAVQRDIVAAGNATSVVAKAMVSLWYCAGLIDQTPPPRGMGFLTLTAPPETYASALVWRAVGGNPMGVPGPYYGNWSYPSLTPITEPPPRSGAERRVDAGAGEGDR